MIIRPVQAADRGGLRGILERTRAFSAAEIAVAMELIDVALGRPGQTDYHVHCIEAPAGRLAGYLCFGEMPLSDRCWDLYWIAVDPALQGRGLGRQMVRFMESDLRRRGARKVFIETGGRASYRPTHRFYETMGYREIARIPDFFAAGDDKVIFGKDVT